MTEKLELKLENYGRVYKKVIEGEISFLAIP